MEIEEGVVDTARRQALALLRANVVGPKKYVEMTYSPHRSLMDGKASLEVENFLKEPENELPAFAKVNELINEYIQHNMISVLAKSNLHTCAFNAWY